MKKVSIFIVSLAILVLASACVVSDQPTSQDGEDQKQTEEKSKDLTFGDTFTFDDLEITISDQINWVKLDNQFSENNGADVIEIPVTIKNLKDQTHGLNAFYYNFYGPDGNKLDSVFSYFDNDVFSAGDMRSGSTQNTYFHLLYAGDGDYYIEFSFMSDPISVKIPILK